MFVPLIGLSQQEKNSISFIGGGEYQNAETTAWNIELNYSRQINSSRFYAEFGLNFSILEYTRDDKVQLYDDCGPFPTVALGSIPNAVNGYYHSSISQYHQIQSFRLQAGVNYHIIEKSTFTLSGGLNFVNQLVTRTYDHGQYVRRPDECADSIPTYTGTYSTRSGHNINYDKFSALIQPHVDFSVQLSPKISFTSRIAYYWQVAPRIRHSRAQLNVGLKYSW